jgi:HEXXH motif-containing protein
MGPRVYVTVDDALGLAQALIHETAHQKLDALGVHMNKADRLIVNDAAESYPHPHFAGRREPMTAVFHEQYTFIHVAALNLHMLAEADNARERQRILMLLARNTPRMEAGHDEIAGNIRTDRDGALFVDALLKWSRNVLARGRAELDANGYGFAPIQT